MPRQRITLALLRALTDAGVATDAGTMSEGYWLDLLAQPRTVLAVSAGANGQNGALFVVFGRLVRRHRPHRQTVAGPVSFFCGVRPDAPDAIPPPRLMRPVKALAALAAPVWPLYLLARLLASLVRRE